MTPGAKLRAHRKRLGYTLAQVAKEAGMARQNLSRLERSKGKMREDTRERLLAAFGRLKDGSGIADERGGEVDCVEPTVRGGDIRARSEGRVLEVGVGGGREGDSHGGEPEVDGRGDGAHNGGIREAEKQRRLAIARAVLGKDGHDGNGEVFDRVDGNECRESPSAPTAESNAGCSAAPTGFMGAFTCSPNAEQAPEGEQRCSNCALTECPQYGKNQPRPKGCGDYEEK